ncbi:MAG TPA: hypothetical protein VJ905_10070, partial [Halalkalibaculum sp.]|nr:hypothetical protein [Halalkalibaculum sp.]
VRHNLGAILLKADRPTAEEHVYRSDLANFPDNGWSLFGLWQSLKAQDKEAEAAEVKRKFKEAWKFADINLRSSRMM